MSDSRGDRDSSGAPLSAESDAKAPVQGATPEGESAPDADTKAGSLVGPAPEVSSEETEAQGSESELVGPRKRATPEAIEVRHGMFGVQGTGDTSGYGGLTRTIEFPSAGQPPFGGWWDSVYDRVVIDRGEVTFHVRREDLPVVARTLRDDPALHFEFCSGVSGVHYPGDTGRELHAVYHLLSMTYNRRIRLEVTAPDSDPHVPSLVSIYPTLDWHERETYDMFGLIFDGHPALTRVLMPDDWPGHPQRKDYPLGGIPVEYKGGSIPPPDQRRSYN